MPALEAVLLVRDIQEEEEMESWKWSMSIWASKTCMADSESSEKCRPKMPQFDLTGSPKKKISLKEAIEIQKSKNSNMVKE